MTPRPDLQMKSRLYRSTAGKAVVMGLYERQLGRISFPYESLMVDTRFGATHVLTAGPTTALPLVLIHGVNFASPFMAAFAQSLVEQFRVYIPDIIGQPGRSAEMQAPGRAYGLWLYDVLDQLELDSVSIAGISFGGAVVLDLAVIAPSRIVRAGLIVPGGFAGGGSALSLLFRLFVPWHLYRFFPDRRRIADVVRPLAWAMDEDHYDFFDAILRYVRWLIQPPGPFSRSQLQGLIAPVAVYAARHDIFFPGDSLVKEARNVIPNLAETHVYDSSHFPTEHMQADVIERITRFFCGG